MLPFASAWDDGHRPPPEQRAAANVDLSLPGLTDFYAGTGVDVGSVYSTFAAVFGIGLVSRAFALAVVEPASMATTLTAHTRAMIGLELLLRGEFAAEIDADIRGELVLYPALVDKVTGSYKPQTWRYVLKFPMPDDQEPVERNVAADGVVHVRNNWATAATPWRGVSPLVAAGLSATALANIETRLGHDANTRVLHIIPAPDGTPAARMQTLRNSLSQSRGNATLVESMAGGWGGGRLAAPSRDWEPRRVGPEIPQANVLFRDQTALGIIGALGVPPQLLGGDSGSMREGYRQLQTIEVMPLARLAEEELSLKLNANIRLNFDALSAIDITAKSRAFQGFIAGGLTMEQALTLVGLGMPA